MDGSSRTDTIWNVGSTDVLLLGAGFSCAVTDREAPLMSNFFARLDKRKYWTLNAFLTETCKKPQRANIEEALLKLDQLRLSPLVGVDSFFDECRRRYSEVRKELDDYVIERLNNLPVRDDNWAARLLFEASERTTVITTNYDTTAERILSMRPNLRHRCPDTNCHHCKMCRILETDCSCGVPEWSGSNPTWRGSILKLHGSIAWRRCIDEKCQSQHCLIPDTHCMPFKNEPCACCGGKCSPVLVPPSMVKSFDSYGELRRQWNAAHAALGDAESVMVFGFSFPASDAVICELLRSTLSRSGRLKRIALIDANPKRPWRRLKPILDECTGTIPVTALTVPADGSVPSWFGRC